MHIIPSVDDGSQSIEESVTLLHMAVAQGVGTVIATPHIEKAQNLGLFSFCAYVHFFENEHKLAFVPHFVPHFIQKNVYLLDLLDLRFYKKRFNR